MRRIISMLLSQAADMPLHACRASTGVALGRPAKLQQRPLGIWCQTLRLVTPQCRALTPAMMRTGRCSAPQGQVTQPQRSCSGPSGKLLTTATGRSLSRAARHHSTLPALPGERRMLCMPEIT